MERYYADPVLELPVLIEDWVYECCGDVLRVGDHVELHLTLYGEAVPTDDDEGIEVLRDGRARFVANPVRLVGEEDGLPRKGGSVRGRASPVRHHRRGHLEGALHGRVARDAPWLPRWGDSRHSAVTPPLRCTTVAPYRVVVIDDARLERGQLKARVVRRRTAAGLSLWPTSTCSPASPTAAASSNG
jgi:hypothetical protein